MKRLEGQSAPARGRKDDGMPRQRLSLGVALAALCSLLLPTLATAQ